MTITNEQDHVSDVLEGLLEDLQARRDDEISTAAAVLSQYVTDHKDKSAYRAIDKQVNQLAKAWDKMIDKLAKWQAEAKKIETSCEGFYGDGEAGRVRLDSLLTFIRVGVVLACVWAVVRVGGAL